MSQFEATRMMFEAVKKFRKVFEDSCTPDQKRLAAAIDASQQSYDEMSGEALSNLVEERFFPPEDGNGEPTSRINSFGIKMEGTAKAEFIKILADLAEFSNRWYDKEKFDHEFKNFLVKYPRLPVAISCHPLWLLAVQKLRNRALYFEQEGR